MARSAIIQQAYASHEYQRFRRYIIATRGPTCEYCGKDISDPLDLIISHDPVELNEMNCRDPMVLLNPENVKVSDLDCHNRKHQRFGHEDAARHIYVVYGAPLAGKATLVRQLARRGDMVVSIDRIYQSMSETPLYDKPQNLYANARAVYDLLIDQIKTRYGKWHSAWIVGGLPTRYEREKLADDLGAELVFCECTREECEQRLIEDTDRQRFKAEWMKYIAEWFERYTA